MSTLKTPALRETLSQEQINHIREERQLPLLEFNLTNACNLDCPGCYKADDIREARTHRQDLDTDRVQEYIRAGLERGLEEIWLLGGEPTLHPGWKDICQDAKDQGVNKITVFSNTLTLKPEDVLFLIQNRIRLVGKLNVGPDDLHNPTEEELHIQAQAIGRGKATAKRIFHQVDLLLDEGLAKEGLLVLENLVRTENLPHALRYWRFCREHQIIPDLEAFCDLTLQSTSEVGIPKPEDWRAIKEGVNTIDANYGLPSITPTTPHYTHGCFLPFKALAIDHNETVLPCAPSSKILGNLARKPVDFLPFLEDPYILARRSLTRNNIKGACNDCTNWEACAGGCRSAAEAASKNDIFAQSSLCLTQITSEAPRRPRLTRLTTERWDEIWEEFEANPQLDFITLYTPLDAWPVWLYRPDSQGKAIIACNAGIIRKCSTENAPTDFLCEASNLI